VGLAVLLAAAATAQSDTSHAPLIVPDDQAVDMTVESPTSPAPDPEARTEDRSAGPAPVANHDDRPIGPASPATAGAPVSAEPPSPMTAGPGNKWEEIGRVGMALGVVLGLLLLGRSMVRRVGGPLAGGGRPSGVLEVLARFPVARTQQIMLLKVAGRVVLVHQTRSTMTTLSEISDPDEVAALLARIEAGSRSSARFHGLFHRFLSRAPTEPDVFPPAPVVDRKVVIDLTRRPPRGGQRRWRKGAAA
jgi:flagellar biogenesis protein FliO